MNAPSAIRLCRQCGNEILPYMHADCHPCSVEDYCSGCATADAGELEFAQWYDAEIEPLRGPFSFREIVLRAFRQGLAIGREGRA